jgi:hypothetical protein
MGCGSTKSQKRGDVVFAKTAKETRNTISEEEK